MKSLIAFTTLLSLAIAKPSGVLLPVSSLPLVRTGFIQSAPIHSQFHAQDALGQYTYGYADGLSAKQEVKSFDGITRGSYSYVDAEGKLQSATYTADALNGFRIAATNLPKAVEPLPSPELKSPEPIADTLEVAAAKSAHLAALEKAKLESSEPAALPKSENIENLPKPVEDTPEVAKAKAEHFEAKKQAELQAKAAPLISSYTYSPVIPALPFAQAKLLSISPEYNAGLLPKGFAYSTYGVHHWNQPIYKSYIL